MNQLTAKALNHRVAMSALIEPCDDDAGDLGVLMGLDALQEREETGFARDVMSRKGASKRDIRKRGTRSAMPLPN